MNTFRSTSLKETPFLQSWEGCLGERRETVNKENAIEPMEEKKRKKCKIGGVM